MQPLLSSGLGNEFQFFLDSTESGIRSLVEDEECTVVILDLNSREGPLKDRIESARRLIAAQITLLVLADDAVRVTANELVRSGAYSYCRRPPSLRDLRILLRRAHEAALRKQEFSSAQARLEEAAASRNLMIGDSEVMQRVNHLIDRVGNIDASVLINGESGTGKELVARAIHERGSRARRPFVAVACGAIPETLIEAELFGHEKGAFTGTAGAREGFLEQAGDGTLFLDEIGELSLYTQVKLLRVLQQREFSRLGSNRLIPLRARLLFATHRDLDEMVAQGRFRQDLYYRINVMKIETPALQEHSEDIPQIAMHFLSHYSQLFQKRMTAIEPEALALLQDYHWPGNVRELENVIQRAIILTPGTTLRAQDLPRNLHEEAVTNEEDCLAGGSFERQLRDYKIRLAENALRENNGNKTMAARSLCISRGYLHRLIRLAESDALISSATLEGAEI
ncbi:sigma-54 interaction domain-containing protein [Occallatibacter riparius]|uniref:Sigma-54 dependent transcriptional regulator n=1 Tax=Occallatibacter riparius TaxID=1002689 RepID=A0A9J7BJY2_9BACT|nr:sigma-54 dependent transcriptional regulator [Occallatibacter riparius]UWZ82859.1 sigma-54 dependent transcriptional regulator [Occallatibacter riparius]